jgi:very-short-patch-repair endonuclease
MRKRDIELAVRSGALVRERRVWVATPDADKDLRTAARAGVVLSCVTAAERLGLWVLDATTTHVACAPHAGMVAVEGAVLHRFAPLTHRDPNELTDPLVNTLQAVALCQPYEAALAVWDSAVNKELTDKKKLERFPFRGQARELLQAVVPFHDSGLETFVVPRLRWLKPPIRPQVWLFGHRVDFLIGERLVFQIDGGHHVGAQRAADIAHDAELMLRGYFVIRVGYDDVVNHWEDVQERILAAIAQGLHQAA